MIDTASREVRIDGAPVPLHRARSSTCCCTSRATRAVSSARMQLLDAVWGYDLDGYEHNVNTHINRLRAKIEARPGARRAVLTVRGAGYRFSHPQ